MPHWFESSEEWKTLLSHCKSCSDPDCSCSLFVKQFGAGSKRLPVCGDDDATDNTWLWFTFNKYGRFRWQCIFCHKDEQFDSDDVAKPCQISNLLTHQTSTNHARLVEQELGESSTSSAISYTAPSSTAFKELLAAFQKGDAVQGAQKGFDLKSGIIGQHKAEAMLWCLSQARDDDKREALRQADVMVIMRDERRKRMHVRFNCAGPDEASLDDKCGYLGQCSDHTPDAHGITQGTLGIFKDVCMIRDHAPRPLVAKAEFDKLLFAKSAGILEATCVDSASNEVVSVTDSSNRGPDWADAVFPNNKHVLRDSAHSARRLLSRLYNADHVLKDTWSFFILLQSYNGPRI